MSFMTPNVLTEARCCKAVFSAARSYLLSYMLVLLVTFTCYERIPTGLAFAFLFQPLFHFFWLFLLLRCLEVRKNGGNLCDVLKLNSAQRRRRYIPEDNIDVPEQEDDDVKKEREKVDGIMSGATDGKVGEQQPRCRLRLMMSVTSQSSHNIIL